MSDSRPELYDQHGRKVVYIRMSVTDRCDLRCRYCLPEQPDFLPKNEILALEDLLFIASEFVRLGVTKIRVTGGEPLVRRNVAWLLEQIAVLPGLAELVMTTNGTMLAQQAKLLRKAGVRRLNISLDTLDAGKFRQLSRNGDLGKVLAGIEAACASGFGALKLNTVLMQGFNDDELCSLVSFAAERGMDISFIEEMPLGVIGRERGRHYLDAASALEILARKHVLIPSDHSTGGPSRYWQLEGHKSRVGFIAPHSRNFCESCNRVRVTCTGSLYPCLGRTLPPTWPPRRARATVASSSGLSTWPWRQSRRDMISRSPGRRMCCATWPQLEAEEKDLERTIR